MSGKAPPRAPRALLSSFPPSAASSSSSQAQASSAGPALSSRIGAAPPTGPRSLVINGSVKAPPTGPAATRNGVAKSFVNGHVAYSTGPSGSTPTGPSLKYSQKGKQVDGSWNDQAGPSSPQLNGVGGHARPGSVNGQLPAKANPISFRLRPPPPEPKSAPPPPPPPSNPPPPAPPPDVPPPPPPNEPPPRPSLPPTQPRSYRSPPEPPPRSGSQPPPPPRSQPPPPPPSDGKPATPRVPPQPSSLPPEPPHQPPRRPPLPPPPGEPSSQPPPPPSSPPPRPASPKEYSLPPPPPWPPARSEYPDGKSFRVLFDPFVDKDRDGKIRTLIELVREHAPERLKGKGKGKEVLTRFDGEVVEGEPEPVPRDPRKDSSVKKLPALRQPRSELVEVKYEYDENSYGPEPPTAVLVMGLSPLSANANIRRYFGNYGNIASFEPQIDKVMGGVLGIILIRFGSHEEAKKCVEKENGRKLGFSAGISCADGESLRVVFDGEGKVLEAVLKELDARRRHERERKQRKEREAKLKEASASKSTPTTNHSASQTPVHSAGTWRPNQPPPSGPSQQRPAQSSRSAPSTHPSNSSQQPPKPSKPQAPPRSLVQARLSTRQPPRSSIHALPPRPTLPASGSSSSTPITRGRPWRLDDDRPAHGSPAYGSRSPSPISRRPGQSAKSGKQREHQAVLEELSKNGYDHLTIDVQLGGSVREDDVRQLFGDFEVDKILQDHKGWYITFRSAGSARRAATVVNVGQRRLAHHTVNVSVHPPPSATSAKAKTSWTETELVEEAQKMILKDLKAMLEKDIVDRVVGTEVRRIVAEDRDTRRKGQGEAGAVDGQLQEQDANIMHELKIPTLKGLSFRKQKRVREEPKVDEHVEDLASVRAESEAVEMEEPPKKKVKKAGVKKVFEADVESEDELAPSDLPAEIVTSRKRATSVSSFVEGPPIKKAKVSTVTEEIKVEVPAKKKKASKKADQAKKADEDVVTVLLDDLFEPPAITQVRFTPSYDSSPSPPLSPVVVPKRVAPPPRTSTPPNPFTEGICDDDEDFYFARLALSGELPEELLPTPPEPEVPSIEGAVPPTRKHLTGSARTEGYYKISHAEKSAYVAQYAARTTADEEAPEAEVTQPQNITSSRSNRANARRHAQGLEEINQVQRAMALSKGESAATEAFKFNQLQTRKKHLRFARSPIHDWGLYAMEKISKGEMVIEYVGEVIRAAVADRREKAYERQGIGSSYLFRIDEDLVVDATKKGNLGRLINHSCDPNCTAKIITINGEKKIVIYAKQDIELGNEITYDYHFPIEQDKIPCLCGSARCRGYLN
ncbi:histone methyltransferase set1 [Steccherinum ochraceum]|uniref:Histone-lysine N-methyltransferase, H3 lysine-4 specific n=1 Tax=Steccherinum ochraceum TaxID=92696 RepID=A0A4V2MW73_9APHY|nr:histone methyltransferase set1 [Steccherinum ochraceum]